MTRMLPNTIAWSARVHVMGDPGLPDWGSTVEVAEQASLHALLDSLKTACDTVTGGGGTILYIEFRHGER